MAEDLKIISNPTKESCGQFKMDSNKAIELTNCPTLRGTCKVCIHCIEEKKEGNDKEAAEITWKCDLQKDKK